MSRRPCSGGDPFNRCTHTALDPKTGDIYVSDGYGNSRVHKYSPDGKLLFSWGAPGTDPGEFSIAHNIATDADGYVYVADRENHRIQIFDANGNFEDQWPNVHRPCGIYISPDQQVYVGELGWGMAVQRNVPNIGPRVSILDRRGNTLARLGSGYGTEVGQFISPHGICRLREEHLRRRGVAHQHQQLRRNPTRRPPNPPTPDQGVRHGRHLIEVIQKVKVAP